jgi:hypothetical protein
MLNYIKYSTRLFSSVCQLFADRRGTAIYSSIGLSTLLLLLTASYPALAQDAPTPENIQEIEKESSSSKFKDPEDGWFDASRWLIDNIVGFMPIPIIITEPAIDNGLGMAGVFFHQPKGDQMQADKGSNLILPNMSVVGGAYTGNESWFAGAGHFRNWDKDHFRYNVMAGYADINLDWYGSDDIPLGQRSVRFNVRGAMLDQGILARLGSSRWYLGADWRYLNSEVQFKTNLPIELPVVENTVSGVGAVALYENLDYRLSPRKGFKTEIRAMINHDTVGSDFDYKELTWNFRQYFEFGQKYTFSWRLDGASTSGDVPFYLEPSIQIQGIEALRYQGPTAATAEVRGGYDVHPRWTILGFVGAGRTAESISDLASSTTRTSYGVGFRYLMSKVLGMRAGIDIAHGPEGTYVYLVTGSAWNTSGF